MLQIIKDIRTKFVAVDRKLKVIVARFDLTDMIQFAAGCVFSFMIGIDIISFWSVNFVAYACVRLILRLNRSRTYSASI